MSLANDPIFPVVDYSACQLAGLTKRELFAAMAMEGMITAITRLDVDSGIITNRPIDISELSCLYADALLAELAKVQS